MGEFLKSTRFKILLGFLAFLIGIMIYAVTKGGYSVSGSSFINTLTKPIRKVTNGFSMSMEDKLDKYTNADGYAKENESLRAENAALKKQLTEFDAVKAERDELRKFFTIKETHEDFVLSQPCSVIGYVANDPFRSFTIDKGSADGIEPYSPVVTAEGIVGITLDVSKHTANVRTVLSPDLAIASVCSASIADYGIIEGTVLSAEKGYTQLRHLSPKNKLRVGDLMITSGSSGMFPKDYPVGTVKSVSLDSNGLSAVAEIEPCVDVTRLTSVIVITDFTGKKDTGDED